MVSVYYWCMVKQNAYIPISKCKICKKIKDYEYEETKNGELDDDVANNSGFPPEVWKLENIERDQCYTRRRKNPFASCPNCGVRYLYSYSYDYYVNGAEEEHELDRMAPTDVKNWTVFDVKKEKEAPGNFMSDKEYAWRIENLKNDIESKSALDREYAAISLTIYYIDEGDQDSILKLLKSDDKLILKTVKKTLSQRKDDIKGKKFAKLKKN
jgi:hypothetical protein